MGLTWIFILDVAWLNVFMLASPLAQSSVQVQYVVGMLCELSFVVLLLHGLAVDKDQHGDAFGSVATVLQVTCAMLLVGVVAFAIRHTVGRLWHKGWKCCKCWRASSRNRWGHGALFCVR